MIFLEKTKNKLLLLLIVFVLSVNTNSYAQILCDVGNRQLIHQSNANEEYSGLAYSSMDNVFLMPMDDAIGGYHIKGYNLNTNQSFNVSINGLNDDDLEGLTYLENNYFALIEEDKNEVYFLRYNNNTKSLTKVNSVLTGVSLATGTGDGLEGITYDPHSNRLFFVREHFNRELFSAEVVLPTNSTNGSLGQITSVLLSDQYFNDPFYCNGGYRDSDASGLHHLGQNFNSNSPFANNILIVSEGNKKIVEFEVSVSASNTITLNFVDEEFILNEAQPEGITVVNNQIYIVSERGCPSSNVSLSSYSINGEMACADPCNPVLGCTDNMACNYNPVACADDGSCIQTEFNLKVYLEGAYNANTQLHTTTLNTSRKLLPGQTPVSNLATPTPAGQPYDIAPWSYNGNEGAGFTDASYTSDDVDWVLVSFRTSVTIGTEAYQVAGILQKDGSIRFVSNVCLPDVSQPYYVVVDHRNHLTVISANPVNVVNGAFNYDFTIANSYTPATQFGQKQLPTGEWVAYAGDCTKYNGQDDGSRNDISGEDKGVWSGNNGSFDQYTTTDMNLDGDVNGADKIIWEPNNGINSVAHK